MQSITGEPVIPNIVVYGIVNWHELYIRDGSSHRYGVIVSCAALYPDG